MKKSLLLAGMIALVCTGLNVRAADASVVASTSTVLAWPNYHAKPWTVNNKSELPALMLYAPKKNDHVIGDGQFRVRIGTVTQYFDSDSPATANMMVLEGDILGNEAVVRQLHVPSGLLDFQFKVKGKWVSVPPGSSVLFKVVDANSVINKNLMTAVVVTVTDDEDKVVFEVRYNNKNLKKVRPVK